MIWFIQTFKPASPRSIRVLTAALSSQSQTVQRIAAEAIQNLAVSTPEILKKLKMLQASAPDSLSWLHFTSALWELKPNTAKVLPRILETLHRELLTYKPDLSGMEGIDRTEQLFIAAGKLFIRMPLTGAERFEALGALDQLARKCRRVSIQMLLLPYMLKLRFSPEIAVEICRSGLESGEKNYQIQAAILLSEIAEKYPVSEVDIDLLLHHAFVGVRVYGAKVHWLKNHDVSAVLPVLIDALNRTRYKFYNYPEIQSTALGTIAAIGPEARDSIENLKQMTNDPNPFLANAAADTLDKVQVK